MKVSEFIFNFCLQVLCYKCHKINPNRSGSYITSPDWTKNKKASRNPINKKHNKCFQYALTVALHHEELRKNRAGITKIKPFINKYNWDEINFPSEKDNWKKCEKNNVTISLNVLYAKKCILLMFQKITQVVKNKLSF